MDWSYAETVVESGWFGWYRGWCGRTHAANICARATLSIAVPNYTYRRNKTFCLYGKPWTFIVHKNNVGLL